MTGTKEDLIRYRIARAKDTYDDLFDFDKDKVLPYFEPISKLISTIERKII